MPRLMELVGRLRVFSLAARLRNALERMAVIFDNVESIKEQNALLQEKVCDLRNALTASERRSVALILSSRLLAREVGEGNIGSQLVPEPLVHNLADDLETIAQKFPQAVEVWLTLCDNANVEYKADPASNLSVDGNEVANLFKLFVRSYLTGLVLDIGCGIQAVPSYLSGYPMDKVAGIDPFSDVGQHDFVFAKAVSESIPWRDGVFSTLINATSLDHCIDLVGSLEEMKRVLRPNGHLLVWVGFIGGALPYNAAEPRPVDSFHLYHFDRGWFEEIVSRFFVVVERVDVDGVNNFYALRPLG